MVSATFVGDWADDLDAESLTGFSFGAWVAVPVADRFAVVPGAHYVQKGAKLVAPGEGSGEIEVAYLEIPLLLSASLTEPDSDVGFNVFAGPSIAFEVSCDVSLASGSTSVSTSCDDADLDNRVSLDVGAMVGAGVRFPLGERFALSLSGGVDMGLRTLDSSDDPDDVKNRAFFGGAALVIPVG